MHPVEPRERPYRFRNCSHWVDWREFFPRDMYGHQYCPECRSIRLNETYRTEPDLPMVAAPAPPDDIAMRLARWRAYVEKM